MTLPHFLARASRAVSPLLKPNSYQIFQGSTAVLVGVGWLWIYASEGLNMALVCLGVVGLTAVGMGGIAVYDHYKSRHEEQGGLDMATRLVEYLPQWVKGGQFYLLSDVGRVLEEDDKGAVKSIYSVLGDYGFPSEQVYPFATALMAGESYKTIFRASDGRTFEGYLTPLTDTESLFFLQEQGLENLVATPHILTDSLHQTLTAMQEAKNEPVMGISSQVFDHLPLGLVIIDGQGNILEGNPSFKDMIKHTDDLTDVSLSSLLSDKDRPLLAQWIKKGLPFHQPLEIGFLESSARHVEVTFSPVRDGNENRFLLSFVNQTQQKNLELQFAQSQKMQAVGQLAGGIAHDFNNLLTAISGYCDLLLLRHESGDPSFADIMHIRQNANRAASLVKQLLAFSRQQTLLPTVLSVNDILQDIRHLLMRLLGEKVTLSFHTASDIWPVKVDQNQFDQVIINLAVNARDAMAEKGTLTIRSRNVASKLVPSLGHPVLTVGDYVEISIQDTGSGIPPEVTGKIFEPFFTTKEVGKGTGLGLSTVYGIIKQTGGFIFVHSEMGVGTTFNIYLPRHITVEEETNGKSSIANEKASSETANTDLTGQETIVLVEDESAVRSFAVRALQTRGYNVLEAETGEEALELIEEHGKKVDLLISDVVMPEMDGPTLVSRVRQLYPNLKVIFMSGYAEEAFKKNLKKDEVFHFLPKPFSLKYLIETVRKVLSDDK